MQLLHRIIKVGFKKKKINRNNKKAMMRLSISKNKVLIIVWKFSFLQVLFLNSKKTIFITLK